MFLIFFAMLVCSYLKKGVKQNGLNNTRQTLSNTCSMWIFHKSFRLKRYWFFLFKIQLSLEIKHNHQQLHTDKRSSVMRQKRRKNLLCWHVSVNHRFLLVFCKHKILCSVSCLLCCGTKHTKIWHYIMMFQFFFSFKSFNSCLFSNRDKSKWLKTVYYNTISIRNVYICVDYRQHQLLSRPQNMQGMYNLKKTLYTTKLFIRINST